MERSIDSQPPISTQLVGELGLDGHLPVGQLVPEPRSADEVDSAYDLIPSFTDARPAGVHESSADTIADDDTVQIPAVQDMAPNRLRQWKLAAQRLGRAAVGRMRTAVIVAETAFPINEAITYGPPVLVGLLTKDPVATGLAAGAPTAALEWLGGRAGAKLLGARQAQTADGSVTERQKGWAEHTIDRILDSKAMRTLVPGRGEKVDPVTKGIVTLYGGTVAGQKLLEREDSGRTEQELRRFSDRAAGILGAVCTAEAIAVEEGIANWDRPYIVGPLVAAGLVSWLGLRKLRQRIASRHEQPSGAEVETGGSSAAEALHVESLLRADEIEATSAKPNYNLSAAEMGSLESELVTRVKEKYPDEGVVGVWIRPTSKYANFIRVHEASFFGEVQEVSEEDEKHTLFLALVDTRSSSNRIVHGGTVTGISYEVGEQLFADGPELNDETTGFYTVDELIELGNFTHEEFYDYYTSRGYDLAKCAAVETNFIIRKQGQRTERFQGLRAPEIAYLMFFKLLQKRSAEVNKSGVFATINQDSVRSFERFGLTYEPLMGRRDLKTPEAALGRTSIPVAIPYDDKNAALFSLIDIPECLV